MSICCSADSSPYMAHMDLFRTTWFADEDSPYRLTVKDLRGEPTQTLIHVGLYVPPAKSFSIPILSKLWKPSQVDLEDIKRSSKAAHAMNSYMLDERSRLFDEVASETDDLVVAEEYLSNFANNCVMFNRSYVQRLKNTVLKGVDTDVLTTGTDFRQAERLLHKVNQKRVIGEKIYLISYDLLFQQLDYADAKLFPEIDESKSEKF